jgi:hypothetical protein
MCVYCGDVSSVYNRYFLEYSYQELYIDLRRRWPPIKDKGANSLTATLPKALPIYFLKQITNEFSSEIGRSPFGGVYKV